MFAPSTNFNNATIHPDTGRRVMRGSQLTAAQQQEALRMFTNRHTGDHKPVWARTPMPNGDAYPVQFRDDRDWLDNTWFQMTPDGKLCKARNNACWSRPTWPKNPELRKAY